MCRFYWNLLFISINPFYSLILICPDWQRKTEKLCIFIITEHIIKLNFHSKQHTVQSGISSVSCGCHCHIRIPPVSSLHPNGSSLGLWNRDADIESEVCSVTQILHLCFRCVYPASLSESLWSIIPFSCCLSQDTLFVSAMRFFLSASDTEWCLEDGEETEWRQRNRERDKMQSCKCHVQTQTPVSQCYFHPPLQKSKQYVICLFLLSVTWCTKIHSGDKEENSQQND